MCADISKLREQGFLGPLLPPGPRERTPKGEYFHIVILVSGEKNKDGCRRINSWSLFVPVSPGVRAWESHFYQS